MSGERGQMPNELSEFAANVAINGLRAENDSLRAQVRALREALSDVVAEVSWFVARKKDLAKPIEGGERTWADALDNDLDIARNALAQSKGGA